MHPVEICGCVYMNIYIKASVDDWVQVRPNLFPQTRPLSTPGIRNSPVLGFNGLAQLPTHRKPKTRSRFFPLPRVH